LQAEKIIAYWPLVNNDDCDEDGDDDDDDDDDADAADDDDDDDGDGDGDDDDDDDDDDTTNDHPHHHLLKVPHRKRVAFSVSVMSLYIGSLIWKMVDTIYTDQGRIPVQVPISLHLLKTNQTWLRKSQQGT